MIVASPDVYVFPPGLARVRELLAADAPPDRLVGEFIEYAKQVSASVHKTLTGASSRVWAKTKPDDDGTQDQLRAMVKQAAAVGREVLGRADGTPAAARVRRALEILDIEQQNIVTGWPEWVSQEEIHADIAAGRFTPVDEAFAQIAGMSVDDWNRYVEDHKAKREGRR